MKRVRIIGGGLAGCEAAYQLLKRGAEVTLYECKPVSRSPVHTLDTLAELVCSNSLKSKELTGGCGLLKQELTALDSLLIGCAYECAVPAGSALAVERNTFSELVTERLQEFENFSLERKLCDSFIPLEDEVVIVATGPLTDPALLPALKEFSGDFLHFFDAVAPIVTGESIDFDSAFVASRYGKGEGDEGDYVNCPMNRSEFENFYEALISAQTARIKDFENNVFEGCMPVEVMAKRGIDTIRFGMLKPVGLWDKRRNEKPYAVLQLRKEDSDGRLYNLVGCQTHLLFGEQKRVFGLIPALKNAEFVRYGVMHKNTYINSPDLLLPSYRAKSNPRLFFAGQITGVEGYVESIASGLIAGINAYNTLIDKPLTNPPEYTMIGALSRYISTPNSCFSPMNSNYGILPPLYCAVKDKKQKKLLLAQRALNEIGRFAETV